MSEWNVLFDENYWGSSCLDAQEASAPAVDAMENAALLSGQPDCVPEKKRSATKEQRISEAVQWCGETWKLLSFYTCPEGLVLDYCKKIDPQELEAYMGHFQAAGFDEDYFDEELFERIQMDNPTSPNVEVTLFRGETGLPARGTSSLTYVSKNVGYQENDPLALSCMAHYGLDTRYCWAFSRSHYLWDDGHAEDLSGLTAVFDEREITVPGEHFHLTGDKEKIPLTNPVTGQQFDLCIEQVEAQELAEETLKLLDESREMSYPVYYETVSYYTDPEIPGSSYFLKAQVQGDSPVRKDTGENAAAVVAVIGGSNGATSIFVAGNKQPCSVKMRSICSPLFFTPTPVRDWRICYQIKRREALSVNLHTV